MTARPQRRSRRPGATVVETAFVLAIALLLLFGIYEYSRYVMVRSLVENAAREGARYAVVHTADKTTADVQNCVRDYLAGVEARNLQGLNIQVFRADSSGNNLGTWTDAKFGEYIAVRVDANYNPILPTFLFMPSTIPIQGLSLMYSEAN